MTEKIEKQDEQVEEETVETQESKKTEKTLTQSEVNALLAKEKRSWQQKYDAVAADLKSYQDKEAERETQLQTKLDELKKNAPAELLEVIEYAPLEKQIQLLEKHNSEKLDIPNTPKANGEEKPVQKPLGTIF